MFSRPIWENIHVSFQRFQIPLVRRTILVARCSKVWNILEEPVTVSCLTISLNLGHQLTLFPCIGKLWRVWSSSAVSLHAQAIPWNTKHINFNIHMHDTATQGRRNDKKAKGDKRTPKGHLYRSRWRNKPTIMCWLANESKHTYWSGHIQDHTSWFCPKSITGNVIYQVVFYNPKGTSPPPLPLLAKGKRGSCPSSFGVPAATPLVR
jgi:hypothetical protein